MDVKKTKTKRIGRVSNVSESSHHQTIANKRSVDTTAIASDNKTEIEIDFLGVVDMGAKIQICSLHLLLF